MKPFAIGDIRIDRVEESCGPLIKPGEFLVDLPQDAIARNLSWLAPDFYSAATDQFVLSIHSWVVRTERYNILIDTCFGNQKNRPGMPPAHELDTPWLERLAACGLVPEQIDYVMCTHLHTDHVGWNTKLSNGRWVPTFPNARYLFSRTEYDHWNPKVGNGQGWGQEGVFEDSVLPCMEAGQATLVDDGYEVDGGLRIEAAPGHTVGNVIIRAKSQNKTGLFTGDCMHTPLQIAYPDVGTRVCQQPEVGAKTRRRILGECAEHGHLLLPAHFPLPHYGRVTAHGDAFKYHPPA